MMFLWNDVLHRAMLKLAETAEKTTESRPIEVPMKDDPAVDNLMKYTKHFGIQGNKDRNWVVQSTPNMDDSRTLINAEQKADMPTKGWMDVFNGGDKIKDTVSKAPGHTTVVQAKTEDPYVLAHELSHATGKLLPANYHQHFKNMDAGADFEMKLPEELRAAGKGLKAVSDVDGLGKALRSIPTAARGLGSYVPGDLGQLDRFLQYYKTDKELGRLPNVPNRGH